MSSATRASAQSEAPPPAVVPPAVAVVPPACATQPVDADALMSILTAELRADGVARIDRASAPPAPGAATGLATIVLAADPCDAPVREIVVTIEDMATSKRVARRIELGDVAEPARPRALALAIAELLRASWLELVVRDAPAPRVAVPAAVREAAVDRVVAAVPVPVPAERAIAPAPSPNVFDLSLAVEWRAFPLVHTSTYGGRGTLAFPQYTPSLQLRFDGGAVVGSAHDVLGDVGVGLASAGAALLWSTPRESNVAVAVGPRAELGLAWASGSPVDPQTSSYAGFGYVGTASLLGDFHYRLGPSWRLLLELEGGAVFAPFEALADSRRVAGIEGGMFGMSIGLAQLR